MKSPIALICLAAVAGPGCARRTVVPAPPALAPPEPNLSGTPPLPERADVSDYIDLQPGWRLRVVTPLLKSGEHRLRTVPEPSAGSTITFSAENLEGYETALYAVRPQPGGGVVVEFLSAARKVQQPLPRTASFRLPPVQGLVRLIYLTRVSGMDHDMALAAAADRQTLDAITREIQTRKACMSDARRFCAWIPREIAIRPEVPAGAGTWKDAR